MSGHRHKEAPADVPPRPGAASAATRAANRPPLRALPSIGTPDVGRAVALALPLLEGVGAAARGIACCCGAD